MQDLNDLFYFSIVVEQNGFAAAGRALGIPKSRLSRRISQLEERLGVRLLQRSKHRVDSAVRKRVRVVLERALQCEHEGRRIKT
jgi:DNA-binding transcriptional LysR family regulator